jgi:predicted DNA-binding transcriptional regulator AlpA
MTTDDKSSPLPTILDKGDLAQLLRKSERTIDRLHRAHALPEPLIPGVPRWSRTAIERWLAGGTTRRGRR